MRQTYWYRGYKIGLDNEGVLVFRYYCELPFGLVMLGWRSDLSGMRCRRSVLHSENGIALRGKHLRDDARLLEFAKALLDRDCTPRDELQSMALWLKDGGEAEYL